MNLFTPMPVLRRRQTIGLWAVIVGSTLSAAHAYVLEGFHWPSNRPIVLDLQLGSPNGTLTDGSTTWDQVAEAAADVWNPYLGSGVQFETKETNFTPAQGDGANSVFFSSSVFGEGFGDDTLATTVTLYNPSTGVANETDVVFNNAQSFNSYRGPLRRNGTTVVYDLRRVALHELGHALGLAHVPQGTTAIMEPDITDLDTLQADDIAGVESIYGSPAPAAPVLGGGLSKSGVVGGAFSYQISATHEPTSYLANNLPAGLTFDAHTGLISGVPTVAGTYDVTIGAMNGVGTGTATLRLIFGENTTITSSLSVTAYTNAVFYYQIEATGQPTGYTTFDTLPDGLSLNSVTGLLSGTPTAAGTYRINLQANSALGSNPQTLVLTVVYDATLTVLHTFSDVLDNNGSDPSALLVGSDGNLYGTTSNGGAYGNGGGGTIFKLTPDGTLTPLHSFDVFTDGRTTSLIQGADGNFYGTTDGGGAVHNNGSIFRVSADGAYAVVTTFPFQSYDLTAPTLIQAADGNFYGTLSFPTDSMGSLAGSVFKCTPDGILTTLHSFNGTDGYRPSALIQGRDGDFYGTTYQGGSTNHGTLFKITSDGTLTTLHSFAGADGVEPEAPLCQTADGSFYGTTSASSGGGGNGTVFKLGSDGTFTTLHVFTNLEGTTPRNGLLRGADGNFYGLTDGYPLGINGMAATLFKLDADGELTVLHTFADPDGFEPFVELIQDADGNIYGGANGGGFDGGGTIFQEIPSAVPLVYAPPPVVTPTVTLDAAIPQVTVGSGGLAEFLVSLSAVQDHDVTVNYTIKGSAANGTDYVLLSGTKKIKAGKLSKPIKVVPQGDLGGASKKTVVLTLAPGDGYTVGTTGKVKVKIVSEK